MLVVQDGAAAPASPVASPTPKANGRQQHALLHLPHPRHGESALFMFAGDALLEMRRARRSEYACWFVDDRCESQGDILFATRMDPLFLALPALEKARNKTPEHQGRFCSREQIVADWAETCDAAMALSKLSAMNFEVVCDVQEVADDLYFRLSDDKVVAWLTSKVSALLAFKYPAVDLAAWRAASEAASGDAHAALSRDEQIKAIQDADRARGDKVRAARPPRCPPASAQPWRPGPRPIPGPHPCTCAWRAAARAATYRVCFVVPHTDMLCV